MSEVLMNLLGKSDLLIVFIGMALLQWRVVTALDSLAQVLAKLGLSGKEPAPPPPPPQPVPAPVPVPAPAPAPPSPVVDQGLVDFVKKQEGFRANPYWDYKQWSVGYGTKASGPNDAVTEAEAERRLAVEINAAEKLVERITPANAPKGVKQALTDLTYNAGPGWEESGLGTAIKSADWAKAREIIPEYNHAGGQVVPALTARRNAEVSWFDNPL